MGKGKTTEKTSLFCCTETEFRKERLRKIFQVKELNTENDTFVKLIFHLAKV